MEILILSPVFSPAWQYGGIVPASEILVTALSKMGHNITVVTSDALDKDGRYENENTIQANNIEILRFKNISNILAWNRLFLTSGVSKWARKNIDKFDIVHMLDYRYYSNFSFYKELIKFNIPYVITPLHPFKEYGRKKVIKELFDKTVGFKILEKARIIVTQGKEEMDSLIRKGFEISKIRIVPNPVEIATYTDQFEPGVFRKQLHIENDKKIILYLGRLDHIKGIDMLLEAFERIDIRNPDKSVLVIAGPDAGYGKVLFKKILQSNARTKIKIIGPLTANQKILAFKDSDIYVLPSRYEEFGIVPIEAYAAGIPIVITAHCGVNYWMSNYFDLIVEPSSTAIENGIIQLLRMDRNFNAKVDQSRIRLIKGLFSPEVVASQTLRIYEEALSRKV
jgi:glycosyltransferase involved in cell wall biosynthesis